MKARVQLRFALVLAALCFVNTVHAQPPKLEVAGTAGIEGLGTAWPNATNVSKSAQFQVYRWQQGDVPVFQINRPDGRVVAVFAVGADGAVSYGIGEAAGKVFNESNAGAGRAGAASAATDTSGQCPCSSTVVYNDGTNVIVVVTDKNGNVIGIYTFKMKT